MKRLRFYILFFFCFISLDLFSQTKVTGDIFVGISSKNITPPKELIKDRIIHDSLFVKCILINVNKQKLAFVVVDNQGIPQFMIDEAKKQIQDRTLIAPENVIVSSTHTHSGFIANNSPIKNQPLTHYQKLLINSIANSVIESNANLVPAKIGWGAVNKPEYVFNRRWYLKKKQYSPYGTIDSVMMNPGYEKINEITTPAGPVDPELSFIAIKTLDNEPLAIFANYSLHYIGSEGNDISADYYGKIAEHLKQLLNVKSNSNFIALMSNGTSGDINNVDIASKKPHQVTYEKVNMISLDLAKTIVNEYSNIEFNTVVDLASISTNLTFNIRSIDDIVKNNALKIKKNNLSKKIFHAQEITYSDRILRFETIFPKQITIPIQTIKVGELAISAVPFEVFAETGLELKNKSPFNNYFTIGIANGHWGYLPTPEQYKKGGYETWFTVARVQEDASEIIIKEIIKQLKLLKK